MTYQGIINLANTKYDDYANPFFDTDRTLALLYDAIMEFVDEAYKLGETDEQKKEQLLPLVQPKSPAFTNGTAEGLAVATVTVTAITDFMYVYDLGGYFKNPCGAGYIFRPIVPLKIDKFNRALDDSFDKPSDEYPKYKSVNNEILIYSDNAPQAASLKMNYIHLPFQPTAVQLGQNPDLASSTHNAIAAILEGKFDEASEKLIQLQFAQQQAQLQD